MRSTPDRRTCEVRSAGSLTFPRKRPTAKKRHSPASRLGATVGAMAARLFVFEDLLIDADARATWGTFSSEQQDTVLRWVNKPRSVRPRVQRRDEAARGLQLGVAYSGLEQMTIKETLLEFLIPW